VRLLQVVSCSLMPRTLIICFLLLFALPANHFGEYLFPPFLLISAADERKRLLSQL